MPATGLIVIDGVFVIPGEAGDQVWLGADTLRVETTPSQKDCGAADIPAFGVTITVTVAIAVCVQPTELVPVRV